MLIVAYGLLCWLLGAWVFYGKKKKSVDITVGDLFDALDNNTPSWCKTIDGKSYSLIANDELLAVLNQIGVNIIDLPSREKMKEIHDDGMCFPVDKWMDCVGHVDAKEIGDCYLGLSQSPMTDISVLASVYPLDDGKYYATAKFFLPEAAIKKDKTGRYAKFAAQGFINITPGDVVDCVSIKNDINNRINVKEIAYDPWNSTQFALGLQDDGYVMAEVRQGFRSMNEPTKKLLDLVLEGKIIFEDNPVLNGSAAKMVIIKDSAGNIKPDINGEKTTAAIVMALSRAVMRERKQNAI